MSSRSNPMNTLRPSSLSDSASGACRLMSGRAALRAAAATLAIGFAGPALGACEGDLNGDGVVDGADLGALLSAWTG